MVERNRGLALAPAGEVAAKVCRDGEEPRRKTSLRADNGRGFRICARRFLARGRGVLRVTDVLLGSEHFSPVKTGVHQQPIFSGEAGLLGNGLLSQFRVTVDAGKSRLLLNRIQ